MKAVMYGGGNIGRGFIGALFSASGYRVTFVDGAKAALMEIAKLEEEHPLSKLILHYYEMILEGCSLSKLSAEADRQKHESMRAVV